MSKEKHIEELKLEVNIALAFDCSKAKCLNCKFINEENCEPAIIAEHFYEKGYRKAFDLEAEIEDLKAIAEQYQRQFEEARTDVAREIFEELEAVFSGDGFHYFIAKPIFAELKKKWKEEEG